MKMSFDEYDKLESKAMAMLEGRDSFNWFPTQEYAEQLLFDISRTNIIYLLLAMHAPAEKLTESQRKVKSYIRESLCDETILNLVEQIPREEPLELTKSQIRGYMQSVSLLDFQLGKNDDDWFPTLNDIISHEKDFDEQWVLFLLWILNACENRYIEGLTAEQDEVRVYIEEFLKDPDNLRIIEDPVEEPAENLEA